jgi:hypothetical protein
MTNATLTVIAPGGTAEDYDYDGAAGTARWTGSLGVYVTGLHRDDRAESVTQVEGGGDVTEVVRIRVEIPYEVGRLVQRGDTLTFAFEGATQQRIVENLVRTPTCGRVRAVVRPG